MAAPRFRVLSLRRDARAQVVRQERGPHQRAERRSRRRDDAGQIPSDRLVEPDAAFLAAHPDLYEQSHGAARVRITRGMLTFGSLDRPGFASGAAPDWSSMRQVA